MGPRGAVAGGEEDRGGGPAGSLRPAVGPALAWPAGSPGGGGRPCGVFSPAPAPQAAPAPAPVRVTAGRGPMWAGVSATGLGCDARRADTRRADTRRADTRRAATRSCAPPAALPPPPPPPPCRPATPRVVTHGWSHTQWGRGLRPLPSGPPPSPRREARPPSAPCASPTRPMVRCRSRGPSARATARRARGALLRFLSLLLRVASAPRAPLLPTPSPSHGGRGATPVRPGAPVRGGVASSRVPQTWGAKPRAGHGHESESSGRMRLCAVAWPRGGASRATTAAARGTTAPPTAGGCGSRARLPCSVCAPESA
jgi:hypothetical protein